MGVYIETEQDAIVDINPTTLTLTGNTRKFIRYHSDALAEFWASPSDGAAMNGDSFLVKNGNKTEFCNPTDNGTYSCIFRNIESEYFRFSAQDSKGNIGSKEVKVDMVDYVRLTCNILNSSPDANGKMTLSCSGNFFNGSFGEVTNSLTVLCSYTGEDVDTALYSDFGENIEMEITESGNGYYADVDLSGLDYQGTYSFTITVEDELEEVTVTASGVQTKPIFHWGKDDFTFEVPVNFETPVNFNGGLGDLRLNSKGSQGNTLYFGNNSYCYIGESAAEGDKDKMIIRGNGGVNIRTNNLQLNGVPCWGDWTPELKYAGATQRYGWYLKLGGVVVVGFFIKAYGEEGHTGTKLQISGVPFTPLCNALGGGAAYNIYVPGGTCFEGWAIVPYLDENNNPYSVIEPRLQPCNNTSAGDLNIASNAGYQRGDNTNPMTLSGTICYMTNE